MTDAARGRGATPLHLTYALYCYILYLQIAAALAHAYRRMSRPLARVCFPRGFSHFDLRAPITGISSDFAS